MPKVLDASAVPLPLALKLSGPPQPLVPYRPLPGERYDVGLQVRVDRDGNPMIHSAAYRASSTGPSTHLRPGDTVYVDVDGAV